MSARTKARKRALDMLYAADMRQIPVADALADAAVRAQDEPDRQASWVYAREIVQGIIDRADEIDEMIEASAHGWTLDRMPAIDRAILRIGTWEIAFNDDVPAPVAITEAVQNATNLSTDDSPKFVNGVLDRVAHDMPNA